MSAQVLSAHVLSIHGVTAQAWITALVGCAAIVDDLARRRISNWIPILAFLSGLILQSVEKGWRGSLSALAGTAVGASVFLIFYLMGGLGGGDVKLLAGFGAVLGTVRVLEAALWTAGCGGFIALAAIGVAAARRWWKSTDVERIPGQTHLRDEAAGGESIPYAPAIAAGVWLSLASQGITA